MQAHSRSRLLLGLVACFCLGLAHVISRSERAVQLQGLEDEEYMNNLDGAVGFGQRSLAITLQVFLHSFLTQIEDLFPS